RLTTRKTFIGSSPCGTGPPRTRSSPYYTKTRPYPQGEAGQGRVSRRGRSAGLPRPGLRKAEAMTEKQVADRTLAGALLLAVAYLGFVSLGLPDPVAGVAWPS